MSQGILLVDKPGGMTSHDVVARARRALGTRRVGHAGTLDPMATGLLILGGGSATRLLTHLVGLGKSYTATIRLGQATNTDDADGDVTAAAAASGVTAEQVARAVAGLTGELDQVPSSFSAVKVAGRRSYERARAGERLELAPRRVVVRRFEVLAERRTGDLLDLDVAVECSSGTYVRALARDLGAALGVGGHLTVLRRTAVGPFGVEDATPLDAIGPAAVRAPAAIAAALFPVHELSPDEHAALGHGKRIPLAVADAPVLAALGPGGELASLVAVEGGTARVLVNFPTP